MKSANVNVREVEPTQAQGGRIFFRDLVASVVGHVKARGRWYQLAEFDASPRRAYWYRARLKDELSSKGFEFTASVESDGVGRLYARLVTATT